MITGSILTYYEEAFAALPLLVSFVPMLTGTGGNAGSQSSTMIIRCMAIGEVEPRDTLRVIWKEIRVALVVGLILGALNYLRLMLMYPGQPVLCLTVVLSLGNIRIGSVGLGVHTLMYAAAGMMVGVNLVMFSLFVRAYARVTGFIPTGAKLDRWLQETSTEKGVLIGILMFLTGAAITVGAFCIWRSSGFGQLSPEIMMRITVPAMILIVVGIEIVFGSFFIGILNIRHK